MFELLDPRRVAAKKIARLIASKKSAGITPGAEGPRPEPDFARRKLDPLEILLAQELAKYEITMA